jgi:formylglycine-generating enzyme required for sulfatase activity
MKKRIILMVIQTGFILTQLSAQTNALIIGEPEMLEMVSVEGGSFQMGSTDGQSDEKPVHSIMLTYDYWMGKYEVTFDEYDRYCEETGTRKARDEWGRGNHPVINVSWNEAIKYCNWLSKKEGLTAAYDNDGNMLDKNGNKTSDITEVEGYRLPSEAEWEYAARGGNKSKGYTYSGSNNLLEVGWYDDNSEGKTHEVGQKKTNELGLYDMSGNVWEWCLDGYAGNYYGKRTKENPVNLNNTSYRVFRGGSWYYDSFRCRVAIRYGLEPSISGNFLGFRIARTRFF